MSSCIADPTDVHAFAGMDHPLWINDTWEHHIFSHFQHEPKILLGSFCLVSKFWNRQMHMLVKHLNLNVHYFTSIIYELTGRITRPLRTPLSDCSPILPFLTSLYNYFTSIIGELTRRVTGSLQTPRLAYSPILPLLTSLYNYFTSIIGELTRSLTGSSQMHLLAYSPVWPLLTLMYKYFTSMICELTGRVAGILRMHLLAYSSVLPLLNWEYITSLLWSANWLVV